VTSEAHHRALARDAIARAIAEAGGDEPTVLGIETTFARLASAISALVGTVGYDALATRALQIVCTHVDDRYAAASLTDVGLPSQGWREVVARAGEEDAQACASEILAVMLDVMSDLIGEELTLRVTRRAGLDGPSTSGLQRP